MADSSELCVYWVSVSGDRDEYAKRLQQELADSPIACIVVRGHGFDNPNSVVQDVLSLMEANRILCVEACHRRPTADRRIGIALIARTRFLLGQSSSPVLFPDWLMDSGSFEGYCTIIDLSWKITVPFSSDELSILPEIHRRVWSMEKSLLSRFRYVNSFKPASLTGFFESTRNRKDISIDSVLAAASSEFATISNPEAYRPERRAGLSIVSRIWIVAQGRSASDIASCGTQLEQAIDLFGGGEAIAIRPSLVSTIASHALGVTRFVGFGEDLIRTLGVACQFFTLAAHSQDRQNYPIDLVIMFLEDVRESLLSSESIIRNLPETLE
jgi:hypothetical protein